MSKEAKVGYKKNIGTILLLSFAGSIIYGLPYFRSYYYDTYQAMYHLTNTQMGLLGSAYGVLGVFSYIIGGVLADKIKAKKLLIFSMIATGLGGLLHLLDHYSASVSSCIGTRSSSGRSPSVISAVSSQLPSSISQSSVISSESSVISPVS